MNNKQKVINKLKGLKKFKIYWVDEVQKSLEVEGESEQEIRDCFFKGELAFNKEEEGDINYGDGSLEIEELE